MLSVFVPSVSAQVAAETIFPDTTKGFVVIGSLKELADRWKQTQFGQLMQDPIMDSFKEDLRRQLDAAMEERFGLTLDGIEKLPSGELAVGMVAIPGKTPGFVFTMDVTDRLKETESYLERLTKKLVDAGTKQSEETFEGQKMNVFTFPERKEAVRVPPPRTRPRGTVRPPENQSQSSLQRKAYYVVHKDHLVVSDQPHLLKLVCDRMESPGTDSLSSVSDYQVVKNRCDDDLPPDSPVLIRWYIEPLNYGESVRSLLRGPAADRRRSKPSVFAILKEQGFDAIRGIGGVVGIKSEDKEVVHRTFIYAKKPFRLAMQMLAIPNGSNFEPPDWMSADIARCTQFYLDPIVIFDNIGPLFDAWIDQPGVWEDVIRGLKEVENGPQIDIRNELLVHLGQRAVGMSQYKQPITTTSESIVFAIELKPNKDQEVAKALEKLFIKDSDMERKEYKSHILWVRIPPDDDIEPFAPPTGPPIGGKQTVSPQQRRVLNNAAADEQPPLFPNGAFMAAEGYFFIGTNDECIIEILDRFDTNVRTIKDEKEFKDVELVFSDFGITDKPHFLQFFARTDETLRPTYEMIRQGKLSQSQAVFAKGINALFGSADEADPARSQTFDGNKLPEFDKIRHHFGPTGFYGVSEDDGFFFKGFLLEKKGEETEEKPEEMTKEPVKEE